MANLYRAFAPPIAGKSALKQTDKTGTLDATIVLTPTTVAKNLGDCKLAETIVLTLTSVVDVFPIKAVLDAPIVLTSATAVDVIRTGTLDVPIPLVLTGVADYGQNALLDKPITITLTGVAKTENKGQLNRQLTEITAMTLTSAADVQPLKATLDKPLLLTLTGQAQLNTATLASTIVLTSTTATTQKFNLNGAGTLPAFTGNAEMVRIDSTVVLPAFTGVGVLAGENAYIGIAFLPSFEGSASTGHTSSSVLPSLVGASQADTGSVMSSSASLPALTSDAVLLPDLSAAGIAALPALTGTSEVVSVSDITSVVNFPPLTADAIAFAGIEHIGIATLPSLISNAIMQSGQLIVSVVSLPALTANAIADNGGSLTVTTHVFNTENLLATEYSNYDFLAMAMFNGVPVGISTAGVFELSGSDDDGTDITVDVLSGFSDLGTEDLKRMSNVYLGYKSDGDVQVQISIDGEPAVRTYTVSKISHSSGLKRGRAKPGKGLKSRYWQVGVKNVLGSDLELNDLGLYVQQFNRKVQ